jgi:hypothetical protein
MLQQHHQQQQQQQQHQQQQQQHAREQLMSNQDLGLARLGALGALADLSEGGSDLLNEVPSTINYEDLGLAGNFGGHSSSSRHQEQHRSVKNDHKALSNWISKSSELLDLSSGDSRDTPGQDTEIFSGLSQANQSSQNSSQGLIPQIVMNPWDPSQAPVMTFAPLANAVQAYQQQWLSMQAQQQAAGIQQQQQQDDQSPSNAAALAAAAAQEAEEEEEIQKPKVICASPDDEMGFLKDLPPPCNVILQPSTIGLSGKVPESQFLVAFQKFLKGDCDLR